jgi:ADP-L-glycero-D-manno-heptose 6-epimerase
MKILVTGYKGFIGSNLALYLQSQGHEVEGWDYIPNTIPDPSGYDWVLHIGANSSTTETDVDLIMEQNLEHSLKLLQACDMMGTNFQYASSASVYGNTTHFTENGPLQPQSPYAWTKYLFDRFVTQNLEHFQVIVQGFRYFNVYGRNGEEHKGNMASPFTKFSKQAQENSIIKVFEKSYDYKRDFVCVEDICKVHDQMLGKDKSGIFNVGTGRAVDFETVAKTIAKKYDADIEYIPMPENLKGQYQEYTCANIEKLTNIIDIEWTKIEDYIDAV